MTGCTTCGKVRGRKSRPGTGLCLTCYNQHPSTRHKRSEDRKRLCATNPEWLDAQRARLALVRPPLERRVAVLAAHQPETTRLYRVAYPHGPLRAKLDADLAKYPPRLRDEYFHLTKAKGVRASEARRMIDETHELELTRWLRSIGIEAAQPKLGEPVAKVPAPCVFCPDASSEEIIEAIASDFGLTSADVVSQRRSRHLLPARYTAAYVLRKRGNSYPVTGHLLGGRDHSTAAHGVGRFEKTATPDMWAIAARYIPKLAA